MDKRIAVITVGIILLLASSSVQPGSSENYYEIKEIINATYHHEVYLSYENGTPVSYIDTPKEYKLKRVYIYADEDLRDVVESLGFEVRKDHYDIVITTKDVGTNKAEIIFLKGEEGVLKNVTWIVDPLRLELRL